MSAEHGRTMELNEALERLSLTLYRGEDAIAYLRGVADATPAELEADEESNHEAIPEEQRLRRWRNRIIKSHDGLQHLGGDAVIRNTETGELYRATSGGPGLWNDVGDNYVSTHLVPLPAKVIFEGNPL